jgi:hypothetical protein
MGNKGIIVAVVIVAVVLWFLFNKASSTVKGINQSNKQTYTTGTAIAAGVTNLAPALGQFLSGLQGRTSTPAPKYTPAPNSMYTGDGLLSPSFTQSSSISMSDDINDPVANDLTDEGY